MMFRISRPWGVGAMSCAFAAAALSVSGVARADDLSIAPTQATFTFNGKLQDINGQAPDLTALDPAKLVGNTLVTPVESVSVAGKGPGPIRINWPDAGGLQLNWGAYSANVTDFTFDLATKKVTADLFFSYPFPCPTGHVCPAVVQTAQFNDVALLDARKIEGNVDGGSLYEAVAGETFAPVKVNLQADLFLNEKALKPIFKQLGLPQALPGGKLGTLVVAPIAAVPEASTFAMAAVGLAGVLGLRRRSGTGRA